MSVEEAPSAKQRLRRAAIELFAQRGFAGTGIRDIGAAADLSLASLYYHMGTKTGVLVDVMERSLRRMNELADTVVADRAEPEERLAALTRMHVISHAEAPEETLVVDTEVRSLEGEQRDRVVRLRDEYEQRWQSIIDSGCGDGIFTVARPKLARLSLIEMCSSTARWYLPDGPLTLRELATSYIDMSLALVRAIRGGVSLRAGDVRLPPFEEHYELVRSAWRAPED